MSKAGFGFIMGELFKKANQGFRKSLASPEQRSYLARLIQEDEEEVDWNWLAGLSKEAASQEIDKRLNGRRR